MSRHGTILTLTAPEQTIVDAWAELWREGSFVGLTHPRSQWLRYIEDVLRHYHPAASSRDLDVTARSLAPFPLKEKP